MEKHLALIGGGHAHMMILDNLKTIVDKGIKVTVIAPSAYHYYSGMGPGMLGGRYSPDDIRFATEDVVTKQGGTFIRDRVVKIDPKAKEIFTETGKTVGYDVACCNAGSYIPMDTVPGKLENIYPVKPIETLWEAAQKLKMLFREKRVRVSIVGGGPSSAEVAGNILALARRTHGFKPEIHIFARRCLMSGFPEPVRSRVVSILKKKGILIHEQAPVKEVGPGTIQLGSGRKYSTDFIFMATGVRPSPIFENSGLPVGPDKGLRVNRFLQSVAYPEIFGGGDCICFQERPLAKVGVYAVRQNPVLLNNVMAALEEKPLISFDPGPEYLLIFNLGGGIGVLKKKGLVFGGTLAFMIKDYIDRRFIKQFQAIEKNL
ncbi:NAD(P)/FAD-dependent oxidoreductase [Desulfobacter latus]|uniref:FAD-dependent oxidoreductase n=1 Tax=Desulfobacter latus TaxID=2292 RepID=A0A850T0Y7_9BACT|nr:FAD-dependent oxidoreductase [Desulfobacter latus]NWH05363.1 FAD-dependent oxidoreductase [Desulfobacter latus]